MPLRTFLGLQRLAVIAASLLALLAAGCPQSSKESVEQGNALFAANCARCHGLEGKGGLPLWDGGPSPANFHDHAFHMARSDVGIRNTIVNGKGTGMPAFGTTFNDAQLSALVGHVRSLDPGK